MTPEQMQKVGLTEKDTQQIEAHGLKLQQVESMIERLQSPPKFVKLLGAATRDEGIISIGDVEELSRSFAPTTDAPMKFTPMSGAASRMFGFVERFLSDSPKDGDGEKIDELLRGLDAEQPGPKLAFREALAEALAAGGHDLQRIIREGDKKKVLEYVMEEKGLGFRGEPKALIPFHLREGRPVLPLEEHMKEALAYGGGKLHITISPEHRAGFERALEQIPQHNLMVIKVDVEMSVQHPSTDSIALDAETGKIVRDKDGNVAFFPAGHGSLIKNINDIGRAAVLRNVDNVPKPKAAGQTVERYHMAFAVLRRRIKKTIKATLDGIEDGSITETELNAHLDELRGMKLNLLLDDKAYAEAPLEKKKELARIALDRPLKIVGVVENQGEPGGGPFVIEWAGQQLVSIVEKDEIASDQKWMMRDGQFFNPVDILVDPTDRNGAPYDLQRFVNHDRHFIVKKPYRGREVIRMEHPGLWNGAMDGWTSLFVSMPLETFAPVKEVVDLLRPQHQDS